MTENLSKSLHQKAAYLWHGEYMNSTWEIIWPFRGQPPPIGDTQTPAWTERNARRCPVSHSIGGVTAQLQHPQGMSTHGLLWDLSRRGACVLLNQHSSVQRGEELLLRLSPSLGLEVLEIQSLVCWSEASGNRMYLGLFFHRDELPADTFLEFIVRSC